MTLLQNLQQMMQAVNTRIKAVINDTVTAAGTTWSSTKIANYVSALVQGAHWERGALANSLLNTTFVSGVYYLQDSLTIDGVVLTSVLLEVYPGAPGDTDGTYQRVVGIVSGQGAIGIYYRKSITTGAGGWAEWDTVHGDSITFNTDLAAYFNGLT